MQSQKIRIRLRAFDHKLLDQSTKEIVETARRTAVMFPPCPLTRTTPQLQSAERTSSTSIDSLAPTSPVLPLVLSSPTAPWTKYHNVVGITDERIKSSFVTGGDGVVSYESAHLDNVASEISVAADHLNIHRHPRTILHVRQILLDHRDQMLAEVGGDMRTLPAAYQHDPHH